FEFDNLEYYFGEAAPEVTCRLVGGVARDDMLEYGCRYEKGGYVPYWNVVSSPRYDRYGNLTMYTSSSKGIRKCLNRPVIITALPAYKVAGDEEPELKFTIYDVRRQEYITLATTGTLIREAGETPGEYAIGTGTLQLPAHYEVAEFIGAAMEIRHNVIAVSEQEPESIRTLLKKSGIFASVTGSLQQALDEIRPNGEILLFPGKYGTGDDSPFIVGTSCSLINHEGTLGSAVLSSPVHMSDAVTSFTAEGIAFAPEQPESCALNLSRAVPEITVSNSAFMGNRGIFAGNYTSMSLAQCSFNTSGCGILLANEDNTSPAPHLENLTFHTPEPDCGTHTFISIGGDTFSGGIRTLQIVGVTLDGRSVTDQDDAYLEFMQHCQCRMTIEIHR
ncbi:MAG: hypothetical protein J6S21_00240, partial [Victivallales bacterium]|nr:hypothetical protein [Victivallales bacterium]